MSDYPIKTPKLFSFMHENQIAKLIRCQKKKNDSFCFTDEQVCIFSFQIQQWLKIYIIASVLRSWVTINHWGWWEACLEVWHPSFKTHLAPWGLDDWCRISPWAGWMACDCPHRSDQAHRPLLSPSLSDPVRVTWSVPGSWPMLHAVQPWSSQGWHCAWCRSQAMCRGLVLCALYVACGST